MMRLRRGKREDGFTLIELMVVVAILAILAIIAIPRVMDALERSRNSEAIATATAIRDGMMRFYADFEVYPLDSDTTTEAPDGWKSGPVQPNNLDTLSDSDQYVEWNADKNWDNFRSAMYEYLDIRNLGVVAVDGGDVFEYTVTDRRYYEVIIQFANATGKYEYVKISPEYVVWAEDGDEDWIPND